MKKHNTKKAFGSALAVAALLFLSACGSEDGNGSRQNLDGQRQGSGSEAQTSYVDSQCVALYTYICTRTAADLAYCGLTAENAATTIQGWCTVTEFEIDDDGVRGGIR